MADTKKRTHSKKKVTSAGKPGVQKRKSTLRRKKTVKYKPGSTVYFLYVCIILLVGLILIMLGKILFYNNNEFSAGSEISATEADSNSAVLKDVDKIPDSAPKEQDPADNQEGDYDEQVSEKINNYNGGYIADEPLERENFALPDGSIPRIAVIIDDCGGNLALFKRLTGLKMKTTPAIIPHLQYSLESYDISVEKGIAPILHQPMQPVDSHRPSAMNPGKGAVYINMSKEEIYGILDKNINSMGYFIGANNHMGSLATADRDTMKHVLTYFMERGMFFIDSRTTHLTVVPEIAKQIGLPYLERDVFLDNSKEKSEIRKSILLLIRKAHENGYAIGIGHLHKNTIDVLAEFSAEMHKYNVEFVYITDILSLCYGHSDTT